MCTKEESPSFSGKRLTVSKLKKYKGFEQIGEEEATKIIEGLYQLSLLTYAIYQNNSNKER